MRPNRLFLIAFLCVVQSLLSAQSPYILTLEGKRIDLKNFPYYVVQVTDARVQNYCLGMAQVGISNRRVPVFSKDSLTAELSGLFTRSFGPDTAGRKPLIVRINHLFVYEAVVSTEQAFLEISLSFLQPRADGYVELATIGATSMKQSGTDVSRKHDDNIVAGIEDCLRTFNERAGLGLLGAQLVPAAMLHLPPAPASFAVLQTGPTKAGLYHTFSDFLNNTPNEKPGIPIEMIRVAPKGRRMEYYKLKTGGQLQDKISIWGVSDGHDAYALVSGDYYRIERQADSLLITAPGPVSAEDAITGALIGGLIAGPLGGMVGGALAADKIGPATRYQIDLLSSSLTPVNLPNSRKVEARIILFCSDFAKSPITVHVDGQPDCTLEKSTFKRLRLPPPADEITIQLEANGKTYREKVKPALFNTQVYLLRFAKGEPRLDVADGEMRPKLLLQIDNKEAEERCKQ